MGWANCGTDNHGRPIGYAVVATCDHPECNREIDRGLSYACGGYHGGGEDACDRYFCDRHLVYFFGVDGQHCVPCGKRCFRESGAQARALSLVRSRRNQATRRRRRHGVPR